MLSLSFEEAALIFQLQPLKAEALGTAEAEAAEEKEAENDRD